MIFEKLKKDIINLQEITKIGKCHAFKILGMYLWKKRYFHVTSDCQICNEWIEKGASQDISDIGHNQVMYVYSLKIYSVMFIQG